MNNRLGFSALKSALQICAMFAIGWCATCSLQAQAPASAPQVPDWALPASPTHKQVPPPEGFHRATRTSETPIGFFEGQSDIGGALVPGNSSYDATTGQYTINSAGYNIWYQRDEFRYLWKKASGDFSIAADVTFPNAEGFGDRKVVIDFRQSLDDDAKSIMVGQHGAGMIHLAYRSDAGVMMKDLEYRFGGLLTGIHAKRIGIEKHGDSFAIFISLQGEPMHQFGPPFTLHLDEPFYVGIGFCSHQPATVDTAVISNLVFENSAGKVH
jgi:hypothetical protein